MRRADDPDDQRVAARRGSHHVERWFRGGARSRDTGLDAQLTRRRVPVADSETVQGAEDLRMAPEQPGHEDTEEGERHGFEHEQRGQVALRAARGRAVSAR